MESLPRGLGPCDEVKGEESHELGQREKSSTTIIVLSIIDLDFQLRLTEALQDLIVIMFYT